MLDFKLMCLTKRRIENFYNAIFSDMGEWQTF